MIVEALTPDDPADAYMYSLIIPVLPFALLERVQIHQDEVQQWIGILLAAYGAGLLVGSRKFPSPQALVLRGSTIVDAVKRLRDGLRTVGIPVEALTFGA